jgi:hypothetical protein
MPKIGTNGQTQLTPTDESARAEAQPCYWAVWKISGRCSHRPGGELVRYVVTPETAVFPLLTDIAMTGRVPVACG